MARDVATREADDELEVAPPPTGVAEGLEDIDAGDILLPIIKINHREGVFQDSLTNEKFEDFDAVVLGLIKNRILWPSQMEDDNEGKPPLCRSLDFKHGRPDPVRFVAKDASSGKFPSKESKFPKDRILAAMAAIEEDPVGAEDGVLLDCGGCQLKEWDSNPSSKTPWCSEQFIFPIIRITEEGGRSPAYMTFQRASLKSCRAYISAFKGANRPMFTVVTNIRAVHQKRGQVDYVTPEFTKSVATDPSDWASYATDLHRIRSFLTTPRPPRDADTSTVVDNDDHDDDDEQIIAPPPKGKTGKRGKDEVIEANVVEDDDDEPTPSTKQTAAAAAPAPTQPDDDDDDDDDEPF